MSVGCRVKMVKRVKRAGIQLQPSLSVKFQEVVHAKESWDTWVNEDPKHPTTSNA
jgi:hypothetical protein